jgi:hypothetical protein
MKKIKKTRLHVERDVLRSLKTHELRQVDGGNTIVVVQITGDSKDVCCA